MQDPKNQAYVLMADLNASKVFGDWIPQDKWDAVVKDRTGIVMTRIQAARWHKKVGDTFTMISKQVKRADGKTSWDFKVLAIADDVPEITNGYVFGNYDYIDKAKTAWPTRARSTRKTDLAGQRSLPTASGAGAARSTMPSPIPPPRW